LDLRRERGQGPGDVVAVGADEHAGQHRDAQDAADLAGDVVDGAGNRPPVLGQPVDDEHGARCDGQAETEPEGQQTYGRQPPAHQRAGAVDLRDGRSEDGEAAGHRRQPTRPGQPGTDPAEQSGRQRGTGAHPYRDHQERRGGLQRAQVPDDLQVLRGQHEQPERGEELQAHQQRAAGEPPVEEQPHVQ
jgi:hypothetical protein